MKLKNILFLTLLTFLVLLVVSGHSLLSAWITASDQVTIPSLVESLIRNSWNFFGWQLSRASFLFPDAFVYLILKLISGNRFFAMIYASLPTLLIWQFLIHKQLKEKTPNNFVCIVWTFGLGVVGTWLLMMLSPQLTEIALKYQFSFANHYSSYVYSILFIYLAAEYVFNPQAARSTLWLVSLLLFLCAASNRLIWMFYFAPLIAALVLKNIIEKKKFKEWAWSGRFSLLNFVILYLAMRFEESQYRQNEMPYDRADHSLLPRFKMFLNYFPQQFSSYLVLCFFLFSIISLFIAIFWLWRNKKNADKKYFFVSCLVFGMLINAAGAVLAWEGDGSSRYLMAVFFSPILIFATLLPLNFFQKRIALMATYFAIAVSFGFWVFQFDKVIKDETIFLNYQRKSAEKLSSCIFNQGLKRGLGNYWYARHLQFMSSEKIWVSHLNPALVSGQNLFFYWGNDLFSFQQFNDLKQPFDFIMADYMDQNLLQNAFGIPERKVQCEGQQVWIYSFPNKIFKGLVGSSVELFEKELRIKKETFVPSCIFKTSIETSLNCELNLSLDTDEKNHAVLNGFSMHFDSGRYLIEIKTRDRKSEPLEVQLTTQGHIPMTLVPISGAENSYEIKIEKSLDVNIAIVGRKSEIVILGVSLKRIGSR